MNMLMMAPLRDSRGKIRYFIGAQVDVSGLAKDCTDLESLQQLVQPERPSSSPTSDEDKDDFRELSEMLNMTELETIRKHGGRMHREHFEDDPSYAHSKAPHMPRLLLQEPLSSDGKSPQGQVQSGKLSGIYQNVRSRTPPFAKLTMASIFSFDLTRHFVFSSPLRPCGYLVFCNRRSWIKLGALVESEMSFLPHSLKVVESRPKYGGSTGLMTMGEIAGSTARL